MIAITTLAAEKVKFHLERRGKGLGIRLGVKTNGCSGLSYIIEYVDTLSTDDINFVSNQVQIFVDPKSLVYIDGVVIDWQKKGLNEGFEFANPNEKDRCGCGESFRI
jgi:iron-sulfur cluster assembly protein